LARRHLFRALTWLFKPRFLFVAVVEPSQAGGDFFNVTSDCVFKIPTRHLVQRLIGLAGGRRAAGVGRLQHQAELGSVRGTRQGGGASAQLGLEIDHPPPSVSTSQVILKSALLKEKPSFRQRGPCGGVLVVIEAISDGSLGRCVLTGKRLRVLGSGLGGGAGF